MKKKSEIKLSRAEFPEVAEMLKSLAHPERLAILELLTNCRCDRMTVRDIYRKLNLDQPVASKHLGIMKRTGLVKREAEGNKTFFSLNYTNAVTACLAKCLNSTHD